MKSISALNKKIENCTKCPRLASYIREVANRLTLFLATSLIYEDSLGHLVQFSIFLFKAEIDFNKKELVTVNKKAIYRILPYPF